MTNPGNRVTGAESIDQPFARRRSMGKRNSRGPTRADSVALAFSRATTVREVGDVAVELGSPRAYIDKILARDCRNQIKVMQIQKAARRFHRLKQEIAHRARKRTICSRVVSRIYRPPKHGGG